MFYICMTRSHYARMCVEVLNFVGVQTRIGGHRMHRTTAPPTCIPIRKKPVPLVLTHRHVGTDPARQLTAQCCPCICRRLQSMEEVRPTVPDIVFNNGSWRGRLPRFGHERWFLVTHPEKHDDYNTWIVHNSWQNESMSSEPQWRCRWWGVWHLRDGPQVGHFVDRTRNAPRSTGVSSYVVAAIRVGLNVLSPVYTKPY